MKRQAKQRRAKDAGSELYQELQEYLADAFPDYDSGDAETAIYWFANDYYSGQGDPLYSVLSYYSEYKPGRLIDSIDDESEEAQEMYRGLEREYGDGGEATGATEATEADALDIDDEDHVAKEMAKALDVEEADLKIRSAKNYESFGAGTVWEVTLGKNQEYYVVADDEVASDLAVEIVKQDLETEPEIFNQEFLEQHIDEKKLREELESDVRDMAREDLEQTDTDDFWRQAEGQGMYVPDEDEDGERRDPTEQEIEELVGLIVDDRLKDPIEYLEDIYGKTDAMKQAIKIAGIDVDAAATEAVNADGAGHFLGHYDGETHETPGGFVYWREN